MWNPDPVAAPGHERGFTCSGIVVTALPERLGKVREALRAQEGIQLHQEDPASGRIVVTQVAGSDSEQADGLRRIQALPGVLAADLVYYHREFPGDEPLESPEEPGAG